MRKEQMKLGNGRFQTSRGSCSPDCVGYLWVPLLWLLQVLKMPVEPRERQEPGKVSMSLNFFCWLLSGGHKDRGVMGWPSGVCLVFLEKRGWKPGVLSTGQSLTSHKWCWGCSGVGLLWFLWWARRATLGKPLPSLLLLSIKKKIIITTNSSTAVISGGSLHPPKAWWAFPVCSLVYVKTIPDSSITQAQKLFTKLIPYNEQ